jgi:hypothetical protein
MLAHLLTSLRLVVASYLKHYFLIMRFMYEADKRRSQNHNSDWYAGNTVE